METCCLTVLKSEVQNQGVHGASPPEATGRALPGLRAGVLAVFSQPVKAAHSPVSACRHHCVCVHLSLLMRTPGIGNSRSTLMALSLTCCRMRPHRRWLGPHPLEEEAILSVPGTGCSLWSACLRGREGCASQAWLRGQHQGAAHLCRGPRHPPWPGGPALHQLSRSFP